MLNIETGFQEFPPGTWYHLASSHSNSMNITICALKIEIEIKKDFTEKYKQVFKDRFTRFLKSQHYGLFVYLIFTFIPPFFFFFFF